MENNGIDPITGLQYGKTVQLNFNNAQSYLPGGDAVGRFQNLNEADTGLAFGENQQDVRAAGQGNWQAFFNGVGQVIPTLAGETISGIGYLFDLASSSDQEFGNILTKFGDSITEAGQNFMPVYSSRENQNGFKPFNGEWWGSNISSIASGLSMLVPSGAAAFGATKIAGKAGKAAKVLNGLKEGTTLNKTIGTVSAALTSRHIEGLMEAKGTYEYAYDQALQSGKTHSDATKLAAESAADHYASNYINIGTDLLQYALLGGAFKNVSKSVGRKIAEQAIPEAFEESVQFGLEKEAKNRIDVGLGNKEESKLTQRIGDYISDPQMWTSAFFGAAGGALFSTPIGSTLYNAVKPKVKSTFNTLEKLTNNEITEEDANVEIVDNIIDRAIDNDNIDIQIQNLEDFTQVSEQTGINPENLAIIKQDLEFAKQQINYLSKDNNSPALIKEQVKKSVNERIYNRKIQQLNSDVESLIIQDPSLTPEQQEIARLNIEKNVYENLEIDPQYKSVYNKIKTEKLTEINTKLKELESVKPKKTTVEKPITNAIKEKAKVEIKAETERSEAVKLNNKNAEQKVAEKIEQKEKNEIEAYENNFLNKAVDIENPQQLEQFMLSEVRSNPEKAFYIQKNAEKIKKQKVLEEAINIPETDDTNQWRAFYETNPFTLDKHLKIHGVQTLDQLLEVGKSAEENPVLQKEQLEQRIEEIESAEEESVIIEEYTENTQEEILPKDIINIEDDTSDSLASQTEDVATYRVQDGIVYYYGISEQPQQVFESKYDIDNIDTGALYKTLKLNGQPVKSEFASNNSDAIIDEDFIRSGYVQQGSKVFFQIDPFNEYNKSIPNNIDRTRIVILAEDSLGNKKPIGILKGTHRYKSNPNYSDLKKLRSEIMNDYIKSKPNEMFISSVTSTVSKVYDGRFNNINRKTNPLNVLSEGQKLKLGIGYHTTSTQDNITIKGDVKLDTNNEDVGVDLELFDFNVKSGAVYMFTKTLANNVVPVRLFTKPLKNSLKHKKELLDLLMSINNDNALEVRQKVRDIVKFKKNGKIHPDFRGNFLDVVKPQRLVNLDIITPGDILISQGKNVVVQEIRKEGIVTEDGMITRGDELYIHPATVYYINNDLGNRPLQIDIKKINTGNYNESIADRLETNLAAYQHFHSPKFVISPNTNKEVAESTQEEPIIPEPVIEDDIVLGDILGDDQSLDFNPDTTTNTLEDQIQYAYDTFLTIKEKEKIDRLGGFEALREQLNNYWSDRPVKRGFKMISKKIDSNLDRLNNPKLSLINTNSFKKWDSKQELEWFNKNLPNVPIQVLEDLREIHTKGTDAWGMFYNAAVYISENAKEGTTFHEAFHAVFNMFLTDQERRDIFDEAYKRYGQELGISKEDYTKALNENIGNISKFSKVKYNLKAIDILQSKKADRVFAKGKKNKWSLDKILTELQIPKDQKQIILDKIFDSGYFEDASLKDNIIMSLLADNSFTVNINLSTEYERNEFIDLEKEGLPPTNTQYYSNLTVPGGANYQENEIATPDIIPNIKGHAQFSTDNGIGWFRSDDQRVGGQTASEMGADDYIEGNNNQRIDPSLVTIGGTDTKTRRILEIQSDLFQKGRNKKDLTTPDKLDGSNVYNENYLTQGESYGLEPIPSQEEINRRKSSHSVSNENKFLQLLNKKNNWVTFFVQSIIQDSAKKGYEKVLFPLGNTAAKIEGHETLEEFKKEKQEKIKILERNYGFLDKEYDIVKNSLPGDITRKEFISSQGAQFLREIKQLKQEIADVESGKTQLSSIANFYETSIANILKKNGYNPVTITDEYGNEWNEIELKEDYTDNIKLSSPDKKALETLLKLEEKLAEDFEVYVLERDNNFQSSFTGKVKAFFKRMYDLIKNVIGNKSKIEVLYNNIRTGQFKEFNSLRDTKKFEPKFKIIEGMTPVQKRDRINISLVMLDRVIDQLSKTMDGEVVDYYKAAITGNPDTNLITALNKVNGAYSVYKYIQVATEKIAQTLPVDERTGYLERAKIFLDSIRTPDGQFGPLYQNIVLGLNTRGIRVSNKVVKQDFNKSNELNEEVEIDNDIETRQAWAITSTDISQYEKLGIKLRRWANNIPVIKSKTLDSNGRARYEYEKDDLGMTKYRNPNFLYQELQETIGESVDYNHMIEKLQQASESNDTMYKILSESPKSLLNQLFIHIGQKVHPKFISIVPKKAGKIQYLTVIESNRNTATNIIINDLFNSWSDPTTNKVLNADGSINITNANKAFTELEKELLNLRNSIKNKTAYNRDGLYNLIVDSGFNIDKKAFDKATRKSLLSSITGGKNKQGLKSVFNLVRNNVNPFENETKGVRTFSDIMSNYYDKFLQDTHTKPTGGLVYEWIDANFMGRQTLEFKNRHVQKQDFYKTDPYYYKHPFLESLNDTNFRDSLELYLHTSTREFGRSQPKEYVHFADRDAYVTFLSGYINGSMINKDMLIPFPVLSDSSVLAFLKMPKIDSYEKAIETLYKLAELEYQRTKTPNIDIKFRKDRNSIMTKFPYLQKHVNSWNPAEVKKDIQKYFENVTTQEITKLKSYDLISEIDGKLKLTGLDTRVQDVDYFMKLATVNFAIGQSYIIDMYYGDLAYYTTFKKADVPTFGNFYKRSKEVWSPRTIGNVSNVKRRTYNVKIKKDIIHKDESFINKVEELAGKNAASQFRKGADETDGGSYIDIHRYRDQQLMLENWSDVKQQAYKRLLKGGSNFYDINTVFQPNKPFYYAHHKESNGIVVPIQIKNSEYVILPFMAKYGEVFKQDLESMGFVFTDDSVLFDQKGKDEGKYVDQVIFESNIKVGLPLKENVIFKASNSNWGKQQEVPAHHEDSDGLFGIQLMKLITSNMDSNKIYDFDGGIKGDALIRLYNDSIVKDINEDFQDVIGEMKTLPEVLERLRKEVIERNLGDQYLQALDEIDGESVLPLYHPLHAYRIEAMLNSIFKNKVTKKTFDSGGTFVNVSSYGFDKKPKVVFKEDGGIDYFESYITPNSKDLLLFADKDGFIDLDLLPDKVKEGFMYRIPTEAKYSMAKIKAIGYLPAEAGGAIVLPPEITLIAGLDFDIDKMFGFFYNKKLKLNESKISLILQKEYGKKESQIYRIFNNPQNKREEDIKLDIIDILKNNKSLMKFEVTKSSMDTKASRDNLRIDIMSTIWSDESSSKHILNPGGFQQIEKTTANIIEKKNLIKKEDPLTMSTDISMIKRMISARSLIGIAAVPSSLRPIFQQAETLKLIKPFMFDENFSELNQEKDYYGNYISRNFSENLAAFVDTLKNPQAEYYNINGYTAGVFFSMLHARIPLEPAMNFISQPIIVKFVEKYYNLGGTKQAEQKVFNWYKDKGFGNLDNINTKSIIRRFKFDELKDNLSNSSFDFQKDILKAFIYYNIISKDVTSLVQALKAGDAGAGPTLSQNVQNIQFVESVNLDFIEGGRELLEKEGFLKSFYKKGIVDATKHITDVAKMPDISRGVIAQIIDIFKNFKPGNSILTTKEIENIYRHFIDYISTGFGAYQNNNMLIRELPQILKEYKKKPSKYDPFIKRLNIIEDENNSFIEFKGYTGADPNVIQLVRDSWYDMLVNGTPEEQNIAEMLSIYSFHVSGFRVSPIGFSNLQPVEFFRGLTDTNGLSFNEYLSDIMADIQDTEVIDNTVYENFITQYILNEYRNLSFIPFANNDKNYSNVDSVIIGKDKNPDTIFVSNEEFKLDKDTFVPYIKFDTESGVLLYKQVLPGQYKKVNTLGIQGTKPNIKRITEYYFGENILSSFDNSNINLTNNNTQEDNPLLDQCS